MESYALPPRLPLNSDCNDDVLVCGGRDSILTFSIYHTWLGSRADCIATVSFLLTRYQPTQQHTILMICLRLLPVQALSSGLIALLEQKEEQTNHHSCQNTW